MFSASSGTLMIILTHVSSLEQSGGQMAASNAPTHFFGAWAKVIENQVSAIHLACDVSNQAFDTTPFMRPYRKYLDIKSYFVIRLFCI